MDDKTAWDRFIDGEPVNEAIAKLREQGPDAAEETEKLIGTTAAPVFDEIDRPLTDKERLQLRKIRQLPGYGVMLRIQEKLFHLHRKGAIARSQLGPLENKDAIANEWAYVLAFGRAKDEIRLVVEAELKELETQAKESGK